MDENENKVTMNEALTISKAMKIIANALKEDRGQGSYYHTWQSNIAMIIMDNSDIGLTKSNIIARKFLELLIDDCQK